MGIYSEAKGDLNTDVASRHACPERRFPDDRASYPADTKGQAADYRLASGCEAEAPDCRRPQIR